jgi:large subunit ribosomal protein L25
MNRITLEVDARHEVGKGPARRLRMAGLAPAIFYGKKTEPIKLALNVHNFRKALEDAGSNPIFDLKINDGGNVSTRSALLKERQIRPVNGDLVHLDFIEVHMDQTIEVTVPIEYEGKPIGVEKGGSIQIITRELKISTLPGNIPEVIKVDLSNIDLGHSIHVGEITLPEGVKAEMDESIALAAVPAPKKESEEDKSESEAEPA